MSTVQCLINIPIIINRLTKLEKKEYIYINTTTNDVINDSSNNIVIDIIDTDLQ